MALSPLLYSAVGRASAYPDAQRVVALEWLPAELLIALGVMPMAVADIHNYRKWVAEPILAPQVIDVGQRTEPNLELLQQLQPSLILLSKGYGPTPQTLAPIAPALSVSFNDANGNPLAVAERSLLQLAQHLGMIPQAQQHLRQFRTEIAGYQQRLQAYRQRPLLLFSLLDNRHALVIGKNSLFQSVLDQLGIENAWPGETNPWGSAIIGIERLSEVKQARAVYFEHGDPALLAAVSRTPLWQALPFVRQGLLQQAPAVWYYGATLSALRFCQVLEQALGARQ